MVQALGSPFYHARAHNWSVTRTLAPAQHTNVPPVPIECVETLKKDDGVRYRYARVVLLRTCTQHWLSHHLHKRHKSVET
jgi:hypothetical protein